MTRLLTLSIELPKDQVAADGLLAIAASDPSGNPLTLAAATATDAPISSQQLAAPAASNTSAIAATSTASIVTASTEASSRRPVVDPPSSGDSSRSPLAAETKSSDSKDLIDWQSSKEVVGASGIANSASDKTERLPSLTTVVVSPTAVPEILGVRHLAIVANGNGSLLHPDAVAAAFDDAHILEWVGTSASGPSAAAVDISLLDDDLLDAIGPQWRN